MIKNLTPHDVVVLGENGEVRFPKAEVPARLAVSVQTAETIDGIPTSISVFGEPTGLPNETKGTYFIVSQLIKSALPGRTDLLVPAEVVRDPQGNIIGCRSLGR